MIVSSEGGEKSAKSTFAYTAPLPIVSFSFDMSHDRALYGTKHKELFGNNSIQYLKRDRDPDAPLPEPKTGADITVYELPAPMQLDPKKLEGYLKLWLVSLPAIQRQILEPGTLVIDTMTLLTKHRQDAHLENMPGRVNLTQIEYGIPNSSIREIYTWAKSYQKDMVAVHHLRDEYKDVMVPGKGKESFATGNFETHGIRETSQYVDVVLRNERVNGEPYVRGNILTCGLAITIEGFPIGAPTWNKLVDMIEGAGWSGQKIRRRE